MENRHIEQQRFGLGKLPPDACNTLTTASSFTKQDFESALKKVSQRIEKPKPSPKPS
jgi:hypothetical protein